MGGFCLVVLIVWKGPWASPSSKNMNMSAGHCSETHIILDPVFLEKKCNTPSGKLYAVKISEAILLYVFTMVFPTSLLISSGNYQEFRFCGQGGASFFRPWFQTMSIHDESIHDWKLICISGNGSV